MCVPTLGVLMQVDSLLGGCGGEWPLLGEGALRVAVTGLGAEVNARLALSAVPPPAGLWPILWEDLLAAYAAVEGARRSAHGDTLPCPPAEVLARMWTALVQLCLLRGDYCMFAHLVAAVLPDGLAGHQVVLYHARGAVQAPCGGWRRRRRLRCLRPSCRPPEEESGKRGG